MSNPKPGEVWRYRPFATKAFYADWLLIKKEDKGIWKAEFLGNSQQTDRVDRSQVESILMDEESLENGWWSLAPWYEAIL